MDNLFKLVFNNKVIRKKIFKEIREINKLKNVKKYGQCKINWIIRNNHFQLLIYKFKKQIKTREQFTDDLYFLFLEKNIDLEIFKEILELFPQFKPISSKYSSKIIEQCCSNQSFKDINSKKQFIEYLLNELKIIPTLKSINLLCANGNNLSIIKMFIEKGYYSIESQSDSGLLLCTLKEKDFQLFDKILKLNQQLKYSFQSYFGPTNLLLAKSNDVRFYHSLFGNNDDNNHGIDDKIVEGGYRYNYSLKMYHLTSLAVLYGNLDILKYVCKKGPIYYRDLSFIAVKNDLVHGGIGSLNLLKFFFQENQTLTIGEINDLFLQLCQNDKLECCQYLVERFKNQININFKTRDSSLESNKLEIFDWLLKIENNNIKNGICSSSGLKSIIKITKLHLKDKQLFQYYIDLILKPNNRNFNLITDNIILEIVSEFYFLDNSEINFIFQYLRDQSLRLNYNF
ncbi:hypothetical protein ACTA71_001392 [Dictyostelium dimigraforme]